MIHFSDFLEIYVIAQKNMITPTDAFQLLIDLPVPFGSQKLPWKIPSVVFWLSICAQTGISLLSIA